MRAIDFVFELGRRSAEAGVLVGVVLLAQRILRRRLTPQWQCALWLIVMARLLPFSFSSSVSIFNVFPSWTVRQEITDGRRSDALLMADLKPAGNGMGAAHSPVASNAMTDWQHRWRNLREAWATDPGSAIFWIWLAGALVLAGYCAGLSIGFARRLARLAPLDNPAARAILGECCAQMRVRRTPVLVECGDIATPALYGVFRPRLLLPLGFANAFSADELRFVFLHELAHLRRRDLLLNWIVTALQIVHWFNPLVWFATARWRGDREIACDALVLEAVGAAQNRVYGETMLRLLGTFTVRAQQPGLVGILESKRELARRLRMIARYTPARRPVFGASILVTIAIVGLTEAQPVTPALKETVRSPTEEPAAAPRVAPAPSANQSSASAVAPKNEPVPNRDEKQVSDADVDAVLVDELASRFENDRAKFLAYLRAQGKTIREYRNDKRREIREGLLRVPQRDALASDAPAKVDTAPKKDGAPAPAEPQIHVRLIQLTRNEGDSDVTLLKQAGEILARLNNGEKFEDLAKKYSGNNQSRGGDFGWQRRSDFKKEFADIVFNLKKGEVSAPVLLPEGCYILFVEDRK